MRHDERINIKFPSNSSTSSPSPLNSMGAYIAFPSKPTTEGKVRAVVLIQEAFGVNSHMRKLCKEFAQQGYIAISPELYHRSGQGIEVGYDNFAGLMPVFSKLKNAEILEDLAATFSFLEKGYQVSIDQTAVIGYCMGGLVAMMSATQQPIAAAISYYGGGMVHPREGLSMTPVIQDFKNIQCPTLLFFGGDDKHIPLEDVRKIEAELKSLGKTSETIIYAGADHGFSNDERTSYNPEATHKAWTKSLSWLRQI